ncbi:hypothetical protein L596_023618 [Steinernema carpocapsae]|uniref:Deoxyhypusine hydroxylase n=1 Tax=Steinernema carpocapsae TaxID=34508 RepID=A0A4U5ME67_STECR|nr:hypothetical protein L596_023618 [Steinernema carpocapsae]
MTNYFSRSRPSNASEMAAGNVHAAAVSEERVSEVGKTLMDTELPLASRYRALFLLRNVATDRCVEILASCLNDPSALLKHDIAYCMGQTRNSTAIPHLAQVLKDTKQEAMVRHEAGEALGAIGDEEALQHLEPYLNDPEQVIRETVQLAVQRIKYVNNKASGDAILTTDSPYDSVDPTPISDETDVTKLAQFLVDTDKSMWDRYRAMFALRNINTDESIFALAQGLYCEDSALFRHEIAYVLGQVQNAVSFDALRDRLVKVDENCMVRHECAEALGAIASPECAKLLHEYAKDSEAVVADSCQVALDMAAYEQSGDFQYAGAH